MSNVLRMIYEANRKKDKASDEQMTKPYDFRKRAKWKTKGDNLESEIKNTHRTVKRDILWKNLFFLWFRAFLCRLKSVPVKNLTLTLCLELLDLETSHCSDYNFNFTSLLRFSPPLPPSPTCSHPPCFTYEASFWWKWSWLHWTPCTALGVLTLHYRHVSDKDGGLQVQLFNEVNVSKMLKRSN